MIPRYTMVHSHGRDGIKVETVHLPSLCFSFSNFFFFFFPRFFRWGERWTDEKGKRTAWHTGTYFSFSSFSERRTRWGIRGEKARRNDPRPFFTTVHALNRINMAEITEQDRYAKRWTDEGRGGGGGARDAAFHGGCG